MSKTENHIKILKPLKRNPRRHNPRNIGMIVDSLQEVGAARSIVIDENNEILAGNGTIEAAGEAGITKLQIVEADGETIIAVRRKGLTPEQKARLAVIDNRANETSDWDAEVLAELAAQGVELDDLWSGDELTALLARIDDAEWSDALGGLPSGDKAPFQQMTFTVSDAQAAIVNAALSKAKAAGGFDTDNENSNGNALARICESYGNR